MVVAVTEGVKVSVQSKYESRLSFIANDNYVFSYRVTIENQNDFPIQLLRRHWYITDSAGINREIEGPGVVGEQPVIAPGESFSYISGCDLKSPYGRMFGYYSMQVRGEQGLFKANVPLFLLEANYALN